MTHVHIKTMSGDLISLEVSETETVTSFYQKVSEHLDLKRWQLTLFRKNDEGELKESDELLCGEEDEVFSCLMERTTYVVSITQISDEVYDTQNERYERYEILLLKYTETGPETVRQCLYVKPMYSPTDRVCYYLDSPLIPSYHDSELGDEWCIRIAENVSRYDSFNHLMSESSLGENVSEKARKYLSDVIGVKWLEKMYELFNAYQDDYVEYQDEQDSWS